jgi:hypothetical protein
VGERDTARLNYLPTDPGVEVNQLDGKDVEQRGKSLGVRVMGKAGAAGLVGVLTQPLRCATDEADFAAIRAVPVPPRPLSARSPRASVPGGSGGSRAR